jgi:hypothetical protein
MTQAFPSPSSEEEENRNIIGKIPTCAAENCTGWLVDSFSGKYFVKCEDPKHENNREQVEDGKAASRSTTSTSNDSEQSLLRQDRQEIEPHR